MPIGNFSFPLKGADFARAGRDDNGRFTVGSFQAEARAANTRIAQGTLAYVVRVLENNMRRPTVSSGRLARVTLDPKNTYADSFKVGIGNENFLDRSIAKYWRTIEEGTAATWHKRSFTSLELVGFFGATLLGGGHAGPAYSLPNNSSPRGVFHPVTKRNKRGEAIFKTKGGRPNIVLRPFHPHADVPGMHAYRAAFEAGGMAESWVFQYRKLVDRYFKDIVHTAAG